MSALRTLWLIGLLLARLNGFAAETNPLEERYVFADAKARVKVPDGTDKVLVSIKTITDTGWGPEAEVTVEVRDGHVEITPLAEGIHILKLALPKPVEVRFLALVPPPKADPRAVEAALPRSGGKLMRGEPFTILAMGDSVTNTGDYEGMLALLLKRATGNEKIRVLDRSYPGRSVDAAVRFFENDALPNKPDVGLLMYGLNDQVCFCSLDGFLAQYRFIAERLSRDCGADCVFMQPTPHIEIPIVDADRKPDSNPPEFAFRTIGFAEALRPLAAELNVPLAETFQAIWGRGGETIEASVRAMWPLYPPGYDQQMQSVLETDGRGDTIHPNALGHLAIAKAVFRAMTGQAPRPAAAVFSAVSEWTADGVISHVAVKNASKARREGRLATYPLLEGGPCVLQGDGRYALEPGGEFRFEVKWPEAKKPEDLLRFPSNNLLAPNCALIPVVDFAQGGTRVCAVPAPFLVAKTFVRERKVVTGNTVEVALSEGKERTVKSVAIPPDAEVGRIPLLENVERDGKPGWAAAEVAFVRFAVAKSGEATVDGDLAEWEGHTWSVIGEACQARWVRGPEDHRATPQECYLRWACKAGAQGLFVAVKATGTVEKDSVCIFLDTRSPELLGTPGRYYWVDGSFKPNSVFALGKGETSAKATGLKGAWKKTDDGAAIEAFIPYELMECSAWPASKDLGLSIWWRHTGPQGNTNLMWSEDGHPWNTRWYGVVRLSDDAGAVRPYVVRVR
jgi:lysophospholipase L1-like esterase